MVLVKDLSCSLEPLGLKLEGGMPDSIRLTIRNISSAPVTLTMARPLIDEGTLQDMKGAPVGLMLSLVNTTGYEEVVVYTHPRDKAPAEPREVVMKPGAVVTAEYPLKEFYFWGPCGPATDVHVAECIRPGDQELRMRAILVFMAANAQLKSNAVKVQCEYESFMFRNKTLEEAPGE
jgi:hypothetical protein